MGRGPVVDVKQLQLCNCDDHDRLVQTGLHLATSNARICSKQGASDVHKTGREFKSKHQLLTGWLIFQSVAQGLT